MTKEEYLQDQWYSIDNMPLEKLREYAKRLDASAQAYFQNWQEAVGEVNRLSTIAQQPTDAKSCEGCDWDTQKFQMTCDKFSRNYSDGYKSA
jgi:hypothetical protein